MKQLRVFALLLCQLVLVLPALADGQDYQALRKDAKKMYQQPAKREEAGKLFGQVAAVAPNDHQKYNAMLMQGYCEIYRAKKELDSAKQLFQEIYDSEKAFNTDRSAAGLALIDVAVYQKKDDDAIKQIDDLLAKDFLHPHHHASALIKYAQILNRQKKYKEAREKCKAAIVVPSNHVNHVTQAYLVMAVTYIAEKNGEKVVAVVNKILHMPKAHPSHIAAALWYKGYAQLLLLHENTEARSTFKTLLEKKKVSAGQKTNALWYTGVSFERDSQPKDALTYYKRCLVEGELSSSIRKNREAKVAKLEKKLAPKKSKK